MTAVRHPQHLRPAPSIRPEAPEVDFTPKIAAVPPPPPSARRPAGSSGTEVLSFSPDVSSQALADLVQDECMRGLTRAMKVQSQTRRGVLYFDQGQIVHAECEQEIGIDAACTILSWEEGRMAPGNEFWLHSPSIDMSWQGLLMMTAQKKDEAARNARKSHITERAAPSPPPLPQLSSEPPLTRGIKRKLNMLPDGTILSAEGEGEDEEFSDAIAYTLRLAELIGEGLGLESFDALESSAAGGTVMVMRSEESITAIEGTEASALVSYRKSCGL